MMWILSKEFTFEAAHKLPHHDGKCRNLHGHSWKCTIYVSGDSLIAAGAKQSMVIDYSEIKAIVKPIVDEKLDHQYLNETLPLKSPTSETIARWLYNEIKSEIPNITGVMINETCTSSCFYTEYSQFSLSSTLSNLG